MQDAIAPDPLHIVLLKGEYHKHFAILGQLCAKSIAYCL